MMNFGDFNINNFKLSPRKYKMFLEEADVKAMLWLYSETDTSVKMLCGTFKIDHRTLYYHIRKHGIPLRKPGRGNHDNHPTNFQKSLRQAFFDRNINLPKGGF